ncbi:MAG: L-threonylcarbamoyladenylate synthase [bacterium]|nr:L-threonylcarbamoyladenylate synthase [bacterium]
MKHIVLSEKNWKEVLKESVRLLRRGGVVVYPTETSYGIGVDSTKSGAVAKIFRIKGREEGKPLSVLMASKVMAKQYAFFSQDAERLWNAFLPGALTLRVSPKIGAKFPCARADGTVGIRVSSHPFARALVRMYGKPITATSANLANEPSLYDPKKIIAVFEKRHARPDLLIDAGLLPKRSASTVVDCIGKSVRLLRKGPITATQIKKALK